MATHIGIERNLRLVVSPDEGGTKPLRFLNRIEHWLSSFGLPIDLRVHKVSRVSIHVYAEGNHYTIRAMALRFIHTADWQIGKVFRFVDDAAMGGLQLARLEAITRIGELALDNQVRHVLVAGDVYDHATPSPISRNQVIERMRAHATVEWHLLPGNHDPNQPNGLWDQLCRRGLPDNIHAHAEPAITTLEKDVAVLLTAPLQHRRTLVDPTAWMDNQPSEVGCIRIGLAHGAVHGFNSHEEQRANPIEPTRPLLARLDYLALGDWHGELEVNEHCWYSGTPEPDSFQTHGRGKALLVEIDGPDALPCITPLSTGKYRWETLDEHLEGLEGINLLDHKLRSLEGDLTHTLVNLTLSGALSLADMQSFEERIVEGAAAALYYLRIDRDQLYPEPTDEDLDNIDPGGIIRAAADKLRATAEANGSDADVARAALHRLYIEHKKL